MSIESVKKKEAKELIDLEDGCKDHSGFIRRMMRSLILWALSEDRRPVK